MKELTVKNIADMFGVSKQTIYSWVDKGILTPVKKTPTNRLYFNVNKKPYLSIERYVFS